MIKIFIIDENSYELYDTLEFKIPREYLFFKRAMKDVKVFSVNNGYANSKKIINTEHGSFTYRDKPCMYFVMKTDEK
jgi:hypothetical protein